LYKPAWHHVLGLISALLLVLLIGWIAGKPALFAAWFLAALVALQAWQLIRFERWLRLRTVLKPPNMPGLWGEAVATANRLHRRKAFHKRRVLSLLREFRRMTAAMPDGAILLGPEREILWFNRMAGQWLNLRRKVDYGIRIDNLIRHPDFIDYVNKGATGPAPRIHMPKHGDRWLACNLVTTNTWGLQLLILRDVTKEVKLEDMRRDFVANASHELRSPLTVINGYLDTLGDDPVLDESWRAPVREMQRQAGRMSNIVQDLLELSRLEASSGSAEELPVDVGGMLALMRRDLLARSERPAQVNLQIDSDDMLLGSETELHSIFQNLISNAAKYTPAAGRIDIRWWVDEAGGHVSVKDSGVGIPAEHIPRLTERFYRVDPGRSRKLGGSGLGLAIVKHALQRHGGRLEVQSDEGKGSVFTCHFPVARLTARANA
jgi:two-component system, OmpR family, phosphate regulon sensor histidine kinase PhoR